MLCCVSAKKDNVNSSDLGAGDVLQKGGSRGQKTCVSYVSHHVCIIAASSQF